MPSPRLLLAQVLLLLGLSLCGCNHYQSAIPEKLTIGVVSYEAGISYLDQYERFMNYLAEQTNTVVDIDSFFNKMIYCYRVHLRF